jgi:hypothetical protein
VILAGDDLYACKQGALGVARRVRMCIAENRKPSFAAATAAAREFVHVTSLSRCQQNRYLLRLSGA